MKSRYTFTIDPDIIETLDELCRFYRRSRSSMLEAATLTAMDRLSEVQSQYNPRLSNEYTQKTKERVKRATATT